MRKTWKRLLAGLVAVLLILLGTAGYLTWKSAPRIPERPFEKPEGPYGVGTREYDWVDSSRGEPFTRDPSDRRRLVVQVWYPVASGTPGDTARYLLRPGEFSTRVGAWLARKARTNAILDAPVAPADSGFPVLLYNHGGAWTRWSATFVTEWLASHGYVVLSIEHFGFNQTVRYPDGTPFANDTLSFPVPTGDGKADALAGWAYLEKDVFPVWKADARFVLDRVEAMAREPGPFEGRLDLDRVGALGWSFGGALAVELAALDPRVKAAVDHDGQLFGEAKTAAVGRPVLQFHHGVDDALGYPEKDRQAVRELMAIAAANDSLARARASADWYAVTIAGTDHGDFSDLALFLRRPAGRTDPRQAHRIIRDYTLAFFDRYLKGASRGILDASAPPHAEAKLRVWRRASDTTAR